MLLLRLWNYIHGYVIIVVEGYFLEKFINICIHRQIFLWEVKRQKDSKMVVKMSIRGFRLIRPVARRTRCRVRIMEKKGLPFLMHRYKRRKAFFLGAAIFAALVYLLTSYIWAVEITGNKNVSTQTILHRLEKLGVKPGIWKHTIDRDEIASEMMIRSKDLTWVGVVVKGTKVKVSVAEGVKPPPMIDPNIPCDVVARRDGVIKTVVAKEGQEQVKEGDTVIAGQVLISSTIQSKNTDVAPKQVHALGNIYARTWYEGKAPVQLKQEEKRPTGNQKKLYTLRIFSYSIKLFHSSIPYENYDLEQKENMLQLGKDIILPFSIIIDHYSENNVLIEDIELEEARKFAVDKAYNQALKDIPLDAQILKSDVRYVPTTDGSGETAVVILECEEDIGIGQKIGG